MLNAELTEDAQRMRRRASALIAEAQRTQREPRKRGNLVRLFWRAGYETANKAHDENGARRGYRCFRAAAASL
jgi:hypothetical protein